MTETKDKWMQELKQASLSVQSVISAEFGTLVLGKAATIRGIDLGSPLTVAQARQLIEDAPAVAQKIENNRATRGLLGLSTASTTQPAPAKQPSGQGHQDRNAARAEAVRSCTFVQPIQDKDNQKKLYESMNGPWPLLKPAPSARRAGQQAHQRSQAGGRRRAGRP